jgi:hypothetical protein
VRDLNDALGGRLDFAPRHYEALIAFAHLCFRVEGAPPINVGDALESLQQRAFRTSNAEPPWSTSRRPASETFDILGFSEISAGITGVQRRNREGWAAHATRCKALFTQCFKQLDGRSAAVLGAGKLYDIPLRDLAHRYERLLLVDIDLEAMQRSAERVLGKIPTHVELVECDATGVTEQFYQRLAAIVGTGTGEATMVEELSALLWSYNLGPPPVFLPDGVEGVDTVYSVMLLSQLATPLTRAVKDAFHRVYPASRQLDEPEFQIALKQFTHRLQHDHVRALMCSAESFALITDLAEQYVQLDPSGQPQAASAPLPMVASERVDELIPLGGILLPSGARREASVLAATGWMWPRIMPTHAGTRGSLMGVQAAVAQSRTDSGAA